MTTTIQNQFTSIFFEKYLECDHYNSGVSIKCLGEDYSLIDVFISNYQRFLDLVAVKNKVSDPRQLQIQLCLLTNCLSAFPKGMADLLRCHLEYSHHYLRHAIESVRYSIAIASEQKNIDAWLSQDGNFYYVFRDWKANNQDKFKTPILEKIKEIENFANTFGSHTNYATTAIRNNLTVTDLGIQFDYKLHTPQKYVNSHLMLSFYHYLKTHLYILYWWLDESSLRVDCNGLRNILKSLEIRIIAVGQQLETPNI